MTSGTVADVRIASTLARDSEMLSVSNSLSSQLTSSSSSLEGAITTTSNGLSSRLVATNAALVALLDATNTALLSKIGTTSNALDTAIANEASARAAAVSQLGTGDNVFAGSNHFSGVVTLTNQANEIAGNGAGLTNLSAANLASGILNDGVLSGNVPLLNASTLDFVGSATFGGLTASGAGLTNLNAANLASGTIDDSRLSGNVVRVNIANTLTEDNVFTSSNHYSGVLVATNTANQISGDGSGLSGLWKTTGNSGTTAGTHFLGTTDNQPLQLHANSARVFRLEPASDFTANVIGGSSTNHVDSGVTGATIAGGGSIEDGDGIFYYANLIRSGANHAVISGGKNNTILTNSSSATISGGSHNSILDSSWYAVVGGGSGNDIEISSTYATIAGGSGNTVSTNGDYGAIGGGRNNRIGTNTTYAMIPGGQNNTAVGDYSLAAGRRAKAVNAGAFVWADSQNSDYSSTTDDSFNVRAHGGVNVNASSGTVAFSAGNFTLNGSAVLTSGVGAKLLENNAFGGDNTFNGINVFAGSNHFSSILIATNAANVLVGDGSGLTALNASRLTSGTVGVERLSSSVVINDGNNTFHGNNVFTSSNHVSGRITLTNSSNEIAGDGTGLTGLWKKAGNSGTTPGTDFVGTTDNQALVLKANNLQIAKFTPAPDEGAPNILFGSEINFIKSNVYGSTIGGGGASEFMNEGTASNSVNSSYSTIGGGVDNHIQINGYAATISGGIENGINTNADRSTISGGTGNYVDQDTYAGTVGGGSGNLLGSDTDYSTVAGGRGNSVSSQYAAIGGGRAHGISGVHGTVAGGYDNDLTSSSDYSGVGSGENNDIDGAKYSFIGGGQNNVLSTGADKSTVAGGIANTIKKSGAFIGSGWANLIDTGGATWSIIGAGANNAINGNNSDSAIIVGGQRNTNSGGFAFIGGGTSNVVSAAHGVIPGGNSNSVSGAYGFAAGQRARAAHQGAFVWADSQASDFASSANDTFNVRANGGAYFTTGGNGLYIDGYQIGGAQSARAVKKNNTPIDTEGVLEKLAALPVERWHYSWENDQSVPHIGPYAEDFKRAFYPGRDKTKIRWMEFHGVELAAIQGLNKKLESKLKEKDDELAKLRSEMDELKRLVLEMRHGGGAQ